ncbi:MAG: phage tail tip lysozyme [bacterium]|nr:phage tail tip lysozyme [bacterium]
MKKAKAIILLSIIFSSIGANLSMAEGFDEVFFNLNRINYYDAGDEGCISDGSSSLAGSDNAEKVWNYLKGKGFSDEVTAGVMAGLNGESFGFDPGAVEGSNENPGEGYGIAQWSFERKARLFEYAKSQGKSNDDLGMQLDFLWQELNSSEINALNGIKAAKTMQEALEAWINLFERPNAIYAAKRIAEDISYAEGFLKLYGGKSTASSTSSNYTFLGDSLTVGVKSELEKTFSGSTVNAFVSRGIDSKGQGDTSIIEYLQANASNIKNDVVINIGANDSFPTEQAKTMLDLLKDKKVFLVNSYSGDNYNTTNSNINSVASAYNNVKVLDWKSYVDSNGSREQYYTNSDGMNYVHMSTAGQVAYLNFLKDSLTSSSKSKCKTGSGWNGKYGTSSYVNRTTSSGFPVYLQWEGSWANKQFNGGTYTNTGCVPTSLAMIMTAMGKPVTPDEVGEKIKSDNYLTISSGANTEAAHVVKEYGFQYQDLEVSIAKFNEWLENGGMIVLYGNAGPKPFYSGGPHAVVLYKSLSNGKWLIQNPNSDGQEQDDTEWDPAVIMQYVFAATGIKA